ncbi:MAG: DUF1684 domain-containing protein [Cyclobacteriaceae bacterium]|nr:DUF1684 domain-containing protein [Cyclobacteriaceae bacterium SS2]
MKTLTLVLSLILGHGIASAQSPPHQEEILEWQKEMEEQLLDKEKSPLGKKELKQFDGLDYYPIDSSYRVKARFVRTPNELPFNMPTTTERLPIYVKYGEAIFTLDGREFTLPLYQSQTLLNVDAAEDYLFLPFTDKTNALETYGGGRYLDLSIPEGDYIIIDFNKAYNPYCAYNERYSCPIPPKVNRLDIEIRAGVKDWKGHK